MTPAEQVIWTFDDPVVGLIDYVLTVYPDGTGSLAMNGQGHLPVAAEAVIVLRGKHP
jgi:hypothetical protein